MFSSALPSQTRWANMFRALSFFIYLLAKYTSLHGHPWLLRRMETKALFTRDALGWKFVVGRETCCERKRKKSEINNKKNKQVWVDERGGKNIDINFLYKLGEENECIPGCAEVEALPSGATFFSVYRRLPVVSSIEYMRCIVNLFFFRSSVSVQPKWLVQRQSCPAQLVTGYTVLVPGTNIIIVFELHY